MSDSHADPEPELGWVHAEVQAEFPELRLLWIAVKARSGPSPESIRQRLRTLSNRFRGPQAVTMRQDPIPSAYRIFYRHIGLDPDTTRPALEEAAVERLLRGGFRSENLLDDALLIALSDTGVPLWALDAATLDGPLGIRLSVESDRLGRTEQAPELPTRRLVVADAAGPLAVLFDDVALGHGVTPETTRMVLFAVQVPGVPPIHVEESLWSAVSVLRAA